MSTTTIRRTLAQAIDEAESFKAMFPASTHERWTIAGSIRRRMLHVGDVEHVILPRVGPIPGKGLFGEDGNLVFAKLDELVTSGIVTKHIYGTTGPRWGEKYRGVELLGNVHELFCATPQSWASTLAIRTGPPELSRSLVTGLLKNGLRQKDGQVWQCRRCSCEGRDKLCRSCEGYGIVPVEVIPVDSEEAYFELCGVAFVAPEKRG